MTNAMDVDWEEERAVVMVIIATRRSCDLIGGMFEGEVSAYKSFVGRFKRK